MKVVELNLLRPKKLFAGISTRPRQRTRRLRSQVRSDNAYLQLLHTSDSADQEPSLFQFVNNHCRQFKRRRDSPETHPVAYSLNLGSRGLQSRYIPRRLFPKRRSPLFRLSAGRPSEASEVPWLRTVLEPITIPIAKFWPMMKCALSRWGQALQTFENPRLLPPGWSNWATVKSLYLIWAQVPLVI